MKQRRIVWSICLLIFLVVSLGCCKSKVAPEQSDWREQYGNTQNSTVTPDVGELSPTVAPKAENPTGTTPGRLYPTQVPVPEFVPTENQKELVLFLQGSSGTLYDEHVEAALNLLLQERGYSFYVTIRTEENYGFPLSKWQEMLDAGEKIDLIYFGGEDVAKNYEVYGNRNTMRAILEGYLLPFSQYPDTDAKKSLLSAYPDSYWELSSFQGENYGVSGSVSDLVKNKTYVMLNLDAAEQAGIEVPEQLELTQLDGLLHQAEDAGIPGVVGLDEMTYSGIYLLPGGLYLKYEQNGAYSIINPMEDTELEKLWDAKHRYYENGWNFFDSTLEEQFPLIICERGNNDNWNGDVFFMENQDGKASARVKVYEELPRFLMEGDCSDLLGITTMSECKEEAVELLSLMHTDEEVVKLFRYGIENIHYRIDKEGKLEIIEGWSLYKASLANRIMYLGFEEELGMTNRENDYYEGISEIVKIPYLEDFTEEQKEQLKKIRAITYVEFKNGNTVIGMMNKSGYIILSRDKDYKDQIDKIRTAFAEAGYNELAKEVNEAHGLE